MSDRPGLFITVLREQYRASRTTPAEVMRQSAAHSSAHGGWPGYLNASLV